MSRNGVAKLAAEAVAATQPIKPNSEIVFCSPQEIAERAPEAPPFVWSGYLYRKAVTILASKPKGGKSTITAALLEALTSDASQFLGREVLNGRAVFVTEEGDSTLMHKLPQSAQIRVLTRDSVWPKPSWTKMINAAAAEAVKWDCCLLVIDTFAFWAQLAADKEKDAGAIGAALDVLIEAASVGDFSVLLIHHSKKGGGEDGESLRGSSAIAGAVDVILELERPDETKPGQRSLLALSRYADTPGSMLVERSTEGAWRVIGSSDDRAGAKSVAMRQEVLDVLEGETGGLSREDLIEATGKGWPKLLATLNALQREGLVAVDGAGRKGSPKVYSLAPNSIEQKRTERPDCESSVSVHIPVGNEQTTETNNSNSVSVLPNTKQQTGSAHDLVDEAERILAEYGGDAA